MRDLERAAREVLTWRGACWIGRLVWGRRWSSGLIQPPIAAEATWSACEIERDGEIPTGTRHEYEDDGVTGRIRLGCPVPERC